MVGRSDKTAIEWFEKKLIPPRRAKFFKRLYARTVVYIDGKRERSSMSSVCVRAAFRKIECVVGYILWRGVSVYDYCAKCFDLISLYTVGCNTLCLC